MQVNAETASVLSAAASDYARGQTADDLNAAAAIMRAVLIQAGASAARLRAKSSLQIMTFVREKVRHGVYAVA